MRLKSRLRMWEQNGLIRADQIEAIRQFEQGRTSRQFSLGFQLTGIFSILLGFSMIVAANWNELGPYAKLIGHFILNAGLSLWLFRLGEKRGTAADKPALREGLCLAVFGLNLTFIALIGQVFQLDGSTTGALILWMILTAPMMMIYARARFTAWIWLIALITTIYCAFDKFTHGLDHFSQGILAYFLALFVPLALFADHCMKITKVHRPEFADVFRYGALVMMVGGASLAGFLFYGGTERLFERAADPVQYYLFTGVVTVLAFAYIAFMKRHFKDHEDPTDWSVLAVCTGAIAIPIFLPVDADFLGGALFIGLWMTLGGVWQKAGEDRLVSLAIALVTVRLYIAFLEAFHSLMGSGFGLVIAGALLIGMVKLARNLNARLRGVTP